MTEQEINRVDVRIGLTGALQFMDGSPQAVRNLQHLQSQVCTFNLLIFTKPTCPKSKEDSLP